MCQNRRRARQRPLCESTFLDNQFISSVKKETDEAGKTRLSFTDGYGFTNQIHALRAASVGKSGNFKAHIKWSPKELAQLLDRAIEWWDNDKLGLQHDDPFFLRDPRQDPREMLGLLALVLLPDLASAEKDVKQRAIAMFGTDGAPRHSHRADSTGGSARVL